MVHSAGAGNVLLLQQVSDEYPEAADADSRRRRRRRKRMTKRTTNSSSPADTVHSPTLPTAAPPLVLLTPPLSLEGGLAADKTAPNLLQRILALFRTIRPGSDLTHFHLPPLFNMPKSQLQLYGESVYALNTDDILTRCSTAKTSLDRFTSVLAWSISTTRPPIFGLAPFNPVLGETHHVSNGTLNVMLEQVSHHPPISALHMTDQARGMEMVWCQRPVPKFNGASVEVGIRGKRTLRVLNHGETYEMDSPSLLLRLLPSPGADWSGKVKVECKESGLVAEINYCRTRSVMGFGGNSRSVKGSVFSYGTSNYNHGKKQLVCEIEGQWDSRVTLKHVATGEVTTLYDATEAIGNLDVPVLKEDGGVSSVSSMESAVIWGPVSRCILQGDWDGAREAKTEVEEAARRKRAECDRRDDGQVWEPNHFTLTQTKDGEWECWPKSSVVEPAPIIVHSL